MGMEGEKRRQAFKLSGNNEMREGIRNPILNKMESTSLKTTFTLKCQSKQVRSKTLVLFNPSTFAP
jgi:hypothetical protein